MQPELTIFYDGQCPMCSLEMEKLKLHDKHNNILLVDLHSKQFQNEYAHVNFDKAMDVLHGEYHGRTLLGLEVTHRAWTLVGKGFWVAPLAWPLIKQVSHWVYLLIAKYRHPISNFLHRRLGIGKSVCTTDTCRINKDKC